MPARVTHRLSHAFRQAWRGGYAWVTFGLGMRSACQALNVWFLARYLGPAHYGASLAVASVASILAVFAGLGAAALHLRDLSIGQVKGGDSYRAALWRTTWTTALLAPLAVAVAGVIYAGKIDPLPMSGIAIGEVLAFASADLMQRHFQGLSRYRAMAFFILAVPFARCVGIGIIIASGNTLTLKSWSAVTLVTSLIPFAGIISRLPMYPRSGTKVNHPIREGLGFAVAAGSSRVHADADKTVIARVDSLQAAAIYSVAYRLFDVLMLPVLSFVEWRMASLFRSGAEVAGSTSIRKNRTFITTCLIAGGLAALTSVPLVYVLPMLLGADYAATTTMGHALALLPITTVCWWICRALLSTSSRQSTAATIELVGAAGNLVCCIGLVWLIGWPGAVIATYLAHLAMSGVAAVVISRQHTGEAA